jgi:hypothetical protein
MGSLPRMMVAELTYPGTWLLDQDPDTNVINAILGLLETTLDDAAVALWLFEQNPMPAIEIRNEDTRSQIRASGVWPEEYQRRPPFICARAFVGSLERIGDMLKVLAEKAKAAPKTREAFERFRDYFPTLNDVRDSVAHVEERVLGETRGEPIDFKPVDVAGINAPGGINAIETLRGSRFGCTAANGHFVEVEIERSALSRACECVQAGISALPWKGRERHHAS